MNLDRELEASLRRVMAPAPEPDGAARHVLARLEAKPLPPQKRALLAWLPAALTDLNFAPAWPRVAALACAAVLGISIGLSNLGTSIVTGLDLVRVASADEGNANLFDADSLTGGLRQ
jgi:hypothetical protein